MMEGGATMVMKTGERWHCANPACHCEVLVQSVSGIAAGIPRCVCGSPMKRSCAAPNFSYLDFLHVHEPMSVRDGSQEN
jgi:hypothetical protein